MDDEEKAQEAEEAYIKAFHLYSYVHSTRLQDSFMV